MLSGTGHQSTIERRRIVFQLTGWGTRKTDILKKKGFSERHPRVGIQADYNFQGNEFSEGVNALLIRLGFVVSAYAGEVY